MVRVESHGTCTAAVTSPSLRRRHRDDRPVRRSTSAGHHCKSSLGKPVELWHILAIYIPSTFLGCIIEAFGLSIVLLSQASTVAALMPVGIALGLPAATLIAMFPAVNGYFFLPTYGTIVAAIAFDQAGATRIGKFVLFHSFMFPGLVATISAITIGLLVASVVF